MGWRFAWLDSVRLQLQPPPCRPPSHSAAPMEARCSLDGSTTPASSSCISDHVQPVIGTDGRPVSMTKWAVSAVQRVARPAYRSRKPTPAGSATCSKWPLCVVASGGESTSSGVANADRPPDSLVECRCVTVGGPQDGAAASGQYTTPDNWVHSSFDHGLLARYPGAAASPSRVEEGSLIGHADALRSIRWSVSTKAAIPNCRAKLPADGGLAGSGHDLQEQAELQTGINWASWCTVKSRKRDQVPMVLVTLTVSRSAVCGIFP